MTTATINRNKASNLLKSKPQADRVFNVIKTMEPCTRKDLSAAMNLPISTITGRVADLRDKYVLIKETRSRKNTFTNTDNTLIETFKTTEERRAAIYRKEGELTNDINALKSDLAGESISPEGAMVLKATLRRKEKELNEIKKL